MAERTDERTSETAGHEATDGAADFEATSGAADYEDLLDDGPGESSRGDESGGRGRTVPSAESTLVSLVAVAVGLAAFGAVLPFGSVAGLLGVFAVAFGFGAVGSRSRYLELAAAGVVVSGASTLVDFLVPAVLGFGIPLLVFGAVGGGVAAVLGHYLGRDLRDGLTREL